MKNVPDAGFLLLSMPGEGEGGEKDTERDRLGERDGRKEKSLPLDES